MATTDGGLILRLEGYAEPGLYALGLRLAKTTPLSIGALGEFSLPSGLYLYVGSAWGPGGLAARVRRHLQGRGRAHWHLDYLRAVAEPVALWLKPQEREECRWAAHLLAHPTARIVIAGFGSSDCRCPAHLAYCGPTLPTDLLPTAHFYHLQKG